MFLPTLLNSISIVLAYCARRIARPPRYRLCTQHPSTPYTCHTSDPAKTALDVARNGLKLRPLWVRRTCANRTIPSGIVKVVWQISSQCIHITSRNRTLHNPNSKSTNSSSGNSKIKRRSCCVCRVGKAFLMTIAEGSTLD